jgi:hypothetical protein
LAYNFNNSIFPASPGGEPSGGLGLPPGAAGNAETAGATPTPSPVSTTSPGPTPVTSDHPESAAFVRFRSCRWMQPKEEGHDTEFCTHREVKPYAGMQGFDADAWCPECQYYKLRRAPKKREPSDEYSY